MASVWAPALALDPVLTYQQLGAYIEHNPYHVDILSKPQLDKLGEDSAGCIHSLKRCRIYDGHMSGYADCIHARHRCRLAYMDPVMKRARSVGDIREIVHGKGGTNTIRAKRFALEQAFLQVKKPAWLL